MSDADEKEEQELLGPYSMRNWVWPQHEQMEEREALQRTELKDPAQGSVEAPNEHTNSRVRTVGGSAMPSAVSSQGTTSESSEVRTSEPSVSKDVRDTADQCKDGSPDEVAAHSNGMFKTCIEVKAGGVCEKAGSLCAETCGLCSKPLAVASLGQCEDGTSDQVRALSGGMFKSCAEVKAAHMCEQGRSVCSRTCDYTCVGLEPSETSSSSASDMEILKDTARPTLSPSDQRIVATERPRPIPEEINPADKGKQQKHQLNVQNLQAFHQQKIAWTEPMMSTSSSKPLAEDRFTPQGHSVPRIPWNSLCVFGVCLAGLFFCRACKTSRLGRKIALQQRHNGLARRP